jgi:hypothetical protein
MEDQGSQPEDSEKVPDDFEDLDHFEDDLPDLQIITIMFDNSIADVPVLDLGDTPPWLALTILQSAVSTLEMLIPPVDVTYRGRVVCSSSLEVVDTDSLEGLDDDDE